MADILQTTSFSSTFLTTKFYILIQISLKLVLLCPVDNKSWSVQSIVWCQTGDKPLTELKMTSQVRIHRSINQYCIIGSFLNFMIRNIYLCWNDLTDNFIAMINVLEPFNAVRPSYAYIYSTQLNSTQRCLLQQNHSHTQNNAETETHLGLFASWNLGIDYIVMTSLWRKHG